MSGIALGGRLHNSQQGGASVGAILIVAAIGVFAYALAGAVATDPDRYGRVAIPSNGWVELPGAETGIGVVRGDGSGRAGAPAPADLKIQVIDPRTGEQLRVDARGGAEEGSSDNRWQIAAVDPPSAGLYRVIVTSRERAPGRRSAELSFGQSPLGAVGDRFSEVGDLVIGPVGIAAGALLLLVALRPRVRRMAARRAG